MTKAQQIFEAARALPKRKRAELAQALLESLDAPDLQPGLSEAEWIAEMTRRADEVGRPGWKGVTAKTAVARVRRAIQRRD